MTSLQPGQSILDVAHLHQRLLGDGERLDENAHLAQRPRHGDHVPALVDHPLGHEAVAAVDAALGELAGEAEVGPADRAGGTLRQATRAAHHRDHQIARPKIVDRRPRLDHLRQRLVAEDEIGRSRGRCAVVAARDLSIGTAHADVQHAQQNVGRLRGARLRVIDHAHTLFSRKHRDSSHAHTLFRLPAPSLASSPTGKASIRLARRSRSRTIDDRTWAESRLIYFECFVSTDRTRNDGA